MTFVMCSAEDKVRDRLAQLAREKLGILSKEKQLQLERKKKAMAFLTQIGGKCNFFSQYFGNFFLFQLEIINCQLHRSKYNGKS